MELFNAVAKLTLDSSDFDRDLRKIESQDIEIGEAKVEVDTGDFTKGLDDAGDSAEKFEQRSSEAFSGIKTALIATGILAVVTKITSAFKTALNTTAEMADTVDKGSRRMGISTKYYQEWDHALSQSGGSVEDLNRGLLTFRRIIASGSKLTDEETEALKKMGFTMDDLAGKSRQQVKEMAESQIAQIDSEEERAAALKALDSLMAESVELTKDQKNAFKDLGINPEAYSDASKLVEDVLFSLSKMDDMTKRDNIVDVLFGRNSGGIKPLLDEGEEGMRQLLDEATELGLIMTDEQIANGVAYGDAISNLESALTALQAKFVDLVIPTLTDAATWLTNVIAQLNPEDNSLTTTLENIESKAHAAIEEIDRSEIEAQRLIEELQNMGDYWSLDEQGRMTWDALAARALELFPQLSEYIDKDGKKIEGNTKAIQENIKAWAELEKQRIITNTMGEMRQAVADQYQEAYKKGAQAEVERSKLEPYVQQLLEYANQALNNDYGGGAGQTSLADEFERLYGYRPTEFTTYEDLQKVRNIYKDDRLAYAAWGLDGMSASESKSAWNELWNEYTPIANQEQELRSESESLIAEAKAAEDELKVVEKYLTEQVAKLTDTEATKAQKRLGEAIGEGILAMTEQGKAADEAGETSENAVDGVIKGLRLEKKELDTLIDRWNELRWASQGMQPVANGTGKGIKRHSAGLWQVPSDDYEALLHRDEMVLTASQARRYRDGEGSGIDYNRLEEAIISSIRAGMDGATVNSYLDSKPITDAVSRELAGQMQGRRFGW